MFGFLSQRAYCQLFIALAVGILIGYRWPLPFDMLRYDEWLIWLLVAGLLLIWWLWRSSPRGGPLLLGFAVIAVTGYLSASMAIGASLNAPLRSHAGNDEVVLTGKVVTIPKYKNGHLRFILDVEEVKGSVAPSNGLVYAYVKADEPPELFMFDRVSLYCSLEEVDPPLNRGQFDYRGYLQQRGTVLTSYSRSPRSLTRLTVGRPWPWAQLSGLRTLLTGNLRRQLPERHADLAVSVVYGDKITDLPEATEERFRRAGLTHILVASGTQVSLLILLLSLLFWRVTGDYNWQGILKSALQFSATLGAILLYASVTGFETSIVRALAMGGLVLIGRLAHREADGLTTLAQSGLILLVVNPLQLFAAGFQLSFLATFGLIYLAGVLLPLVAHLSGWRYWLSGALITTGGAQLFVAPVLAASFHQLSLWGLLSNLVAVPMSLLLLTVSAALSLGLGLIPLLGTALSWVAALLCRLLDGWAALFAGLAGSDIAIPAHPLWDSLLFYIAVLLACEWFKQRDQLRPAQVYALKVAVPAAGLVLLGCWLWWVLVPAPSLTALALPGCEGYIWRPYTGRNVLLLSSTGLSRSHNLDTVLSALRYRGINRLHAVYWLDEVPETNPLQGYMTRHLAVGDSAPAEFDMVWLGEADRPTGVLFGLGNSRCEVYPGLATGAGRRGTAHAANRGALLLLIGNRTGAGELDWIISGLPACDVPLKIVHKRKLELPPAGFEHLWGELAARNQGGKLAVREKRGIVVAEAATRKQTPPGPR